MWIEYKNTLVNLENVVTIHICEDQERPVPFWIACYAAGGSLEDAVELDWFETRREAEIAIQQIKAILPLSGSRP